MAASVPRLRFRDEFRDFWRFLRKPTLTPRLPHAPMPAVASDWVGSVRLGSIVRWVLLLWAVNLVVFGPIAAGVATATGASHRLDPSAVPWVLAILWAPIVEELMFRFWLRRPGTLLWLMPAFVIIVMYGKGMLGATVLAGLLALTALPGLPGVRWRFKARRRYRRWFPAIFYSATFAFAILHLLNFSDLNIAAWWLLPVFVLPQWITGLVLGWVRMRRGIGAAILMHACFNAGPVMLLWLLVSLNGGMPLPLPDGT